MNQMSRDGQSQSRATVFARCRSVTLFERLKQARLVFCGNANASIRHTKTYLNGVFVLFQKRGAEGNAAVFGEFDGIA